MGLDKVYKEFFSNVEEGESWAVVLHVLFNLCDRRDKEEHEHIEWFMQLQEDGSIIYSNTDGPRRTAELVLQSRAKWSNFMVRAIFTDELVDGTPVTTEALQDLNNLFHFMNRWEFSVNSSDKYFKVFDPVPAEVTEEFIDKTKNLVADQPLGRLFWSSKDLRAAAEDSKEGGEIYYRLPVSDPESSEFFETVSKDSFETAVNAEGDDSESTNR